MGTPALPEEFEPALTEGERLLYTFTAPSRTMADLRRKASWWVPWLLVSMVSIAFCYTLDKRIGWEQVMQTQMRSNPRAAEKMDRMPPEQREKIVKIQETSARVIGYASPVMTLLMLVAVAAGLLAMFNFGFGAKLQFNEMMGVAAYSYLPSILYSLLLISILFFVKPERFDIRSPIATNVGYFVPRTMPFLKGTSGALDVFTLWQVLLLAIGVSQLSKVKKSTAFAAIFAVVLMFKMMGAALGSM